MAGTDKGLTLEQIAKRARVSLPYLRRVLRKGGAPYVLACRLEAITGRSIGEFLYPMDPKILERGASEPGPA